MLAEVMSLRFIEGARALAAAFPAAVDPVPLQGAAAAGFGLRLLLHARALGQRRSERQRRACPLRTGQLLGW